MEAAVATGAGPAGLTAAEPPGLGGAAEAASAPERLAAAFLSLPGPFQEEDEDDRHKCGRCQAEFTSLEDFVQHKLQKLCQRQQNIAAAATSTTPVIPPVEEPITIAHVVVEASPVVEEIRSAPVVVDSEQFKEIIVTGDHVFENPNGHLDCDDEREQGSPGDPEEEEASVELIKVNLLVNKEGRYVCELCHKTFKTGSILKAHMITHSSKKDYECKLCGTSFRTKGSLIRHHRRHTDERPYECKYCGKSFRESGALTRHLKSLTPCTEKIRFNMNKEIVVNKEDLGTETNGCGAEIVPSLAAHAVEASPVIHLVTDAKGNVLHEVHVQMEELPISETKSLSQEPSNPEELLPAVEESENLLREAMRNSGIVIEQVSVGEGAKSDEADVAAVLAEELKSEAVETVEKLQEEEQYVKIEQVEMADAEVTNQCEHVCTYCGEIFPELNSLELHINRHLGQQLQVPFTIVHPLDTVMAMSKKRKNDSECRIFDEQWTYDYFFTQCKGRAICLLCQESVSVFEEYSLRLHYDAWHKDTYDSLVGQAREDKISMLKQGLSTQETVFAKRKQLNISSLRTSYQVAKLIACAGRPFIEGEFVKECLLSVAKEMYPEKTDLFSRVSLSKSTLTRRIEEMGDNLQQHLQNASRKLCYFSLALDESNDVCDSAHLLIFVRGTNADFEVTEELAALQSIKGTTTGESVYEKVRQIVNDLELDWAKLAGVTTDGAPSMVGCVKGVVARINQEMDKQNRSHPMAIHCLIHPQALCCKSLTWDSVMDVVVSSVNFIRAHAANHKQLQEFLSELNAIYEDSLFPTEVRWVSHGKVLRRFYDLLPEVSAFLQSKNKEEPELEDAEWKWHLAFLTDITEVLNSFTMQLQGKDKLICDMFSHVEAFEVRLDLLIRQVKEENFRHLPMTEKLSAEKPTVPFPNKKSVDSLEMLQREFQIRFKELHLHEQDIQFFQNPFSVDIEIVDPSYQMELAELQSCDSLKDSFKSNRLTNFYASLPSDTYPNLRNHALKMIAFFGSTYVCEQTFSRMKHLKSPLRSRLTDAHLHRLLRLEVTNMEPDIDYLISQKQAQTSH